MKYSILIPTHNRPKLFKRCLRSALDAIGPRSGIEVIVNNDSGDIQEIRDPRVKYFYKKSENLGEIYKWLFDMAQGTYVYYLEDDDVMNPNFFDYVESLDQDIIYGNYVPWQWDSHFVDFFKFRHNTDKDEFLETYDDYHFQFGQILFKKAALTDFPVTNYLQNDFEIFKRLKGTFRCTNRFFYTQTIDGGDNISWESFNKDPRWKRYEPAE